MKIVIDMYGLGFKMHDLTEDQILMAVGRNPQYRERIYKWDLAIGYACHVCSLKKPCNDGIGNVGKYCSEVMEPKAFLQPYFKKEVV